MVGIIYDISSLIKDDLSLEHIRDIKEQLAIQKSTINYQLNKESNKHFNQIQDSLQLLNISQKAVTTIHDKIAEINKLSYENKTSIKRYDIIFNATKLFEIINNTSEINDKIIQFIKLINHLNSML